ncbi:BON domain-containing protein [Mucilaginibacter paludis]|uniref:Transport-associated protein n=1 Tax=Mucilaginibacter paludis DSM 18603 TaxID=714943 RepID=H1Y8D6_9SPHI|nr:BON domain-containing protein [Mucilaginibacter paludis]EHQ24955.1 transport-associated protein [Mucilaginibacter paludis DSM 18603]
MKNDRDLQKDILDALNWEPLLKGAKITVTANNGLVQLSGTVKNYLDKLRAETVTKSIDGVKAMIEHINVDLGGHDEIPDDAIAKAVLESLQLNWVPVDRITVKVEQGHVTLDGEVAYNFQKEAAKKSVGGVQGVRVFTNNLVLAKQTQDQLEKKTIEHALLRYSATVDQNIRVKADKNTITLNGTVQSFYQKEEAEKVAWNAPGVLMVNNELVIE